MPNILDEIVAAKREELASQRRAVSLDSLKERIAEQPMPLSLVDALGGGGVRLMAEVKKASPSRGLLSPDFDPVRLAGTYTGNGASAVSVLTDPRFSRGSRNISPGSSSRAPPATPRRCGRTSSSTHTKSTRPGPSARTPSF